MRTAIVLDDDRLAGDPERMAFRLEEVSQSLPFLPNGTVPIFSRALLLSCGLSITSLVAPTGPRLMLKNDPVNPFFKSLKYLLNRVISRPVSFLTLQL